MDEAKALADLRAHIRKQFNSDEEMLEDMQRRAAEFQRFQHAAAQPPFISRLVDAQEGADISRLRHP